MKSLKICVGASAGGHMNELESLLKHSHIWPSEPKIYITTQQIQAKKLREKGITYVVGECNRYSPFSVLGIIGKSITIMRKEKPDVIITTGSLPIAVVCIVAKIFRKKVVWIDSIAQTENFSLSGRLMYRFADLFFTQWPEVAEKHSKAQYCGALL